MSEVSDEVYFEDDLECGWREEDGVMAPDGIGDHLDIAEAENPEVGGKVHDYFENVGCVWFDG